MLLSVPSVKMSKNIFDFSVIEWVKYVELNAELVFRTNIM